MNQGTFHSVSYATSNWLTFDEALEKNKTCATKNQYPDDWFSKIVNQTLERIVIVSKDQLKTIPKEHHKNTEATLLKNLPAN